jgi:hypothetical protein
MRESSIFLSAYWPMFGLDGKLTCKLNAIHHLTRENTRFAEWKSLFAPSNPSHCGIIAYMGEGVCIVSNAAQRPRLTPYNSSK